MSRGVGTSLGRARSRSPLRVPASAENEYLAERAAQAVGLGRAACEPKKPAQASNWTSDGYAAACAVLWLCNQGRWTHAAIASALGRSPTWVMAVNAGYSYRYATPIKPDDALIDSLPLKRGAA